MVRHQNPLTNHTFTCNTSLCQWQLLGQDAVFLNGKYGFPEYSALKSGPWRP